MTAADAASTTAAQQRVSVWLELLIIAWLLGLYDVINNLAPVSHAGALSHAAGILSLERSLHINVELTLNQWLAGHSALAYIASTYYDLGHFLVTFGVLGVLFWKRRSLYRDLRARLVLINLIAFVVFWCYPVAPPRMLAGLGFTDVVARTDALVSWHTGGLSHEANQYAALPSLHVAWAMWSSLALWRMFPRRPVRALALILPVLTAFIVLATGNHFVVDVIAGALTFLLAGLLCGPARRFAAWLRREAAGIVNRGNRHPAPEVALTSTLAIADVRPSVARPAALDPHAVATAAEQLNTSNR